MAWERKGGVEKTSCKFPEVRLPIGKFQRMNIMTIKPKLTTKAACRVAGIDRDRFNEYVADKAYNCAPDTIPGRARLFDPDDMLALRLFRDLMDDSYSPKRAGQIACTVAETARDCPDERIIAYVETYVGANSAVPYSRFLEFGDFDELKVSGSDIRKVTLFRVGKLRDMNAHYTEEERSIIGEDD